MTWWKVATVATEAALDGLERSNVNAICFDGAIRQIAGCLRSGQALGDAPMCNDVTGDADVIVVISQDTAQYERRRLRRSVAWDSVLAEMYDKSLLDA
jgi:hypothetical protein